MPESKYTTEEILRARSERRDPIPTDEKRVTVRVTVTGPQIWEGVAIDPTEYQPHPSIPTMVGTVSVEMYSGSADRLRAHYEKHAASPREIERAMDDLAASIIEPAIDGIDGPARDSTIARIEHMTGPELLALLTSGRLHGRTSRAWRPSWPASFTVANRREPPALVAVEIVR